jgi:S1-C subfamily serine protease
MDRNLRTIAVILFLPAIAAAAPPRYAAMLANGQRLEGAKLSDWHDVKAMPRLDAAPLMEPSNPIHWLRDRTKRLPELPQAYIEFHSGDRLPGVAVDYRTGQEDHFDPLPAHLVVRAGIAFEAPENRPVTEIRVVTSAIRRIVWQRLGRRAYQPGTAFYRDGRSVQFRAIRFGQGDVHLLLADGDRRIDWIDLAELHLPAVDPWTAWFDQLAILCPNIDTRLYEIETTGGLVATASLARMAMRFEGNSSESDRWVHALQPAWSLDLLWVPFREIAFIRSFAPREVPLSRIAAKSAGQRNSLGGAQAAQINRNVVGGPLRSRTLDFGWGFGVAGGAELTFDLNAGVRSLRAWVCLDRAAGTGGCIRPRILINDNKGAALWEGPVIVGSDTVADTGVLALTGPTAGQKTVVLIVDPVAAGRPAGADPLDIRDHANWCDPVMELDPVIVQAELDKRLAKRFAAWRDWTATPDGVATLVEAGLELSHVRDERRPPPGDFQTSVQVKTKPLILRRELNLSPSDHWLIIAAMRPFSRGAEPKLEVRIGGEAVAEYTVPERQADPNDNRPLAVPLSGYLSRATKAVTVEIRQQAAADSAPVLYRGITTADQLPTLTRILEEEATPAPIAAGQSGSAVLTSEDRYYGKHSVKVTPGGQFRIDLDRAIPIRERPKWGEARFLRFAVRKQTGGRFALELAGMQPRETPARYDLGRGEPSYGAATRIWQDNLPKDWIVITRDLFVDFGSLDLRAIIVGSPDNGEAFIDHVYLARGPQDFDLIPAAPSVELVNDKARQQLAEPIVKKTSPAVVRVEFVDGRAAAGAMIVATGEILTSGHIVIGPNRDCRVTLSDGTTRAAKTLGVARDYDLGLVKIVPDGQYPTIEPHGPADLPQNQIYLTLTQPVRVQEFRGAEAHVTQIRRLFRNTVWTDLEADDWIAGGPLIDRDGRLVGIQVAQSQFGGILCTRLQEAWQHIPRVRNGEVFGAWPPGSEPLPGFTTKIVDGTILVDDVTAAAPAAALMAGDTLQKVDAQPIVSIDDLQRILAQRDAGQEITLDVMRGGAITQAKAALQPRVP